MKIIILNIYHGLVNRGAETVSDALATEFAKLGHQVIVISGGKIPNRTYNQITINNIKIIDTEEGIRFHSKLQQLLSIKTIYHKQLQNFTIYSLDHINTINADVILAMNGLTQLKELSNSEFARKTVGLIHGQAETRWWKIAGYENRRMLKQRIRAFIAVNSNMFNWTKSQVSPIQLIEHIPNGVDLNRFTPLKKIFDKNKILCVAGLQKYKRIDLLIKALSQLEDVELTIVGRGPEEDSLKKLAINLNLVNRIKFMSVQHTQMPKLYQQSSLFTLPSTSQEAFGVSYLEALACNLPVVAPNDDHRKLIVGDAGILVDVTDSYKYSQAIQKALTTNWENRPRQQALKYDWNEIALQYISLFEKLK